MFELIVLALILAGLAALARAPVERQRPRKPTPPAPTLWSARTDWHRFHKPTCLRRGIVPDLGEAASTRGRDRHPPTGQEATDSATGEEP